MNNYQKFGLVSGQVLMGLLFGLAGAIVLALLTELYYELIGSFLDLFGSILSAIMGGYIGFAVGVGYDGYKFLKQNGRRPYFIRFFLQSLVGLTLGLVVIYYLVLPKRLILTNTVVDLLAFILPLSGATIGFNLGLVKKDDVS